MKEIKFDVGEVRKIMCDTIRNNHMNRIKKARQEAGLSQQKMSDLLDIPKRTIEDWDAGKSRCPKWAEQLIVEKLESLVRNKPLLDPEQKEKPQQD